jgi:hypothetical protein
MRTEEGGIEKKLKVGMRKWDPSSSDKAGLPSSLFELRRDMMPRLKMRKGEFGMRKWEFGSGKAERKKVRS